MLSKNRKDILPIKDNYLEEQRSDDAYAVF
jgi:hypothetical protein